VVLLGWYPVPDQTAPRQLQDEHEPGAVDRIEAAAADLPDDGRVETVVVFTHDRSTTVDRLAEETTSDVVVVPDEVKTVEHVLVPIRSDVNADRILDVVGTLLEDDDDVTVTLFHAASEEDEDPSVGDLVLESAAAELVDAGVDSDRVETENVQTDSPVDAIVDAAATHDVLVIGETEPSVVERILGDVPSEIIDRTDRPVFVVRNAE
jgi:nucleotide-binding universal stress UspA family protein